MRVLEVDLHQSPGLFAGHSYVIDIEGPLVPGMGKDIYVVTAVLAVVKSVQDHVSVLHQKALALKAKAVWRHACAGNSIMIACQHYVQFIPFRGLHIKIRYLVDGVGLYSEKDLHVRVLRSRRPYVFPHLGYQLHLHAVKKVSRVGCDREKLRQRRVFRRDPACTDDARPSEGRVRRAGGGKDHADDRRGTGKEREYALDPD